MFMYKKATSLSQPPSMEFSGAVAAHCGSLNCTLMLVEKQDKMRKLRHHYYFT